MRKRRLEKTVCDGILHFIADIYRTVVGRAPARIVECVQHMPIVSFEPFIRRFIILCNIAGYALKILRLLIQQIVAVQQRLIDGRLDAMVLKVFAARQISSALKKPFFRENEICSLPGCRVCASKVRFSYSKWFASSFTSHK